LKGADVDLVALKAELTNDPLGRGYASMDDEAAANALRVNDRMANRDTLDGGLLVASIVMSEYTALTANQKDYLRLLAMSQTLPLTATVKTELGSIFPAGSATRANFLALLKRPGSRADELNLGGNPTPSDVAKARRS
jgi:hypothetical protein